MCTKPAHIFSYNIFSIVVGGHEDISGRWHPLESPQPRVLCHLGFHTFQEETFDP